MKVSAVQSVTSKWRLPQCCLFVFLTSSFFLAVRAVKATLLSLWLILCFNPGFQRQKTRVISFCLI